MFNKKVFLRSVALGLCTVVIAGAAMLSGCTTFVKDEKESEPEDKNPPPVQENKEDKIMPEFMTLVDNNSKPDAIIQFMEDNIAGVSKADASKMLVELEKIQKNRLPELEEKYYEGEAVQSKMFEVYKSDFDLSNLDEIEDAEIKSLLQETKAMGYKVETAEGTFFPIMNYEYLKIFSPYAEEDIKTYINIMAEETNKVPAKDGALVIAWKDVAARALSQEAFLKKFGSSVKADSVKELQKRYLTFLLYGLNNTPLFSYDTKTMDREAVEAYEKTVNENPDSELIQLLGEYLEAAEKSNYKLSDEIESFRKAAADKN